MAFEREKRAFIAGIEDWLGKSIGEPDFSEEYGTGYRLRRGSALFRVYINFQNPEYPRFHADSLLVKIPRNNLLPFYRKLLENNFMMPYVHFSVVKDIVILEHSRHLEDIDASEVTRALIFLAEEADEWDDKLKNEFGCEILGAEDSNSPIDKFFDF
jgi:hypothetical protein